MNQAEFIKLARERAARRQRDGFEERIASRTPEARARVAAAYQRFCEQHAAAKHEQSEPASTRRRAKGAGEGAPAI